MKTLPISILISLKDLNEKSVKLWLQQRSECGPLDALLEFPGGKVEKNELPREAVIRETMEELSLASHEVSLLRENLAFFKFYEYAYPDRKVLLYVFFTRATFTYQEQQGHWKEVLYENKNAELYSKILQANTLIIDDLISFLTLSSKYLNTDGTWQQLSKSQNFF